ncbi:MAG TPA: type II toxin-antitoxin system RelE/ParE family toxin [Planctomycetaceae bacterium]|nr:type II toxin-antitoxin system RelE/ParE family toxin [Planctomycetaceae bacterium]
MKFRVLMEPRAKSQFMQIVRWLCRRTTEGAARWIDAFEQMIDDLEDHADNCGLAEENSLVSREIRETRFKTKHGRTYRAVFTILNGQVRILAIRGPGQAPLKRRDLL